jgi:hypothetical protein
MKVSLACIVIMMGTLLSGAVFADHRGNGEGMDDSFNESRGALPTGLTEKAEGLEMNNKNPRGWNQGEKEGWEFKHHHGHERFKHQYHRHHHQDEDQ